MQTNDARDALTDDGVSRDEMAAVIGRAWRGNAIDQRQACFDLRINQGQFSRLVNGHFATTRGHARRLFAYAKRRLEVIDTGEDAELAALQRKLNGQLIGAWDRTAIGAEALGRILEGAALLGRSRAAEGRSKARAGSEAEGTSP